MKNRIVPIVLVVVALAGVAIWKFSGGKKSAVTEKVGPVATTPAQAPEKSDEPKQPGSPPPEVEVSQADDPVGDLRLEGIVLDDQELPVAGVLVTLDSHPTRTTKSTEDGSFFFDKLIARSYTLVARTTEGVPKVGGPATNSLTATSEPVTLHLRNGANLEVTVVSAENRQPIAKARVKLGGLDKQEQVTDSNGKANFAGLLPDGYWCTVTAEGMADGRALAQVAPGNNNKLEVELSVGSSATGRVLLASGKPAVGAKVTARSAQSMVGASESDGAKTDKNGVFTLRGLGSGSHRFYAALDDYPTATSDLVQLSATTPTTGIEIKMSDGAVLSGRVVDASGAGVAGARIRVTEKEAGVAGLGFLEQVYSGQDGKFELKGLPRKECLAVAMSQTLGSAVQTIDLTPGKLEITFTLNIDGKISGVVVDSNGSPVAGATITCFPENLLNDSGGMTEQFLAGAEPVESDAGGRFAVSGLKPGTYGLAVRGEAEQDNWLDYFNPEVKAQTGQSNVRLVVRKPGSLAGKVQFAEGGAPASFTVSVNYGPHLFQSSDGAFKVDDLRPGKVSMRILGPEFDTLTRPDVVIKEGETTDLGTVIVAKGRSLSGQVVDGTGKPVAGALVVAAEFLSGDGGSLESEQLSGLGLAKKTRSDGSGNFVLHGVGGKKMMLVGESKLGRSAVQEIAAGTTPIAGLTVQLLQPGILQGTVKKNGKPLPSAMVMVQSKGAGVQNNLVTAGPDGSFRFDKLAPGSYQVSAIDVAQAGGQGGSLRGTKEAEIVGGKTVNVEISFDTGSVSLTITAKEKDNKPLGMIQLILGKGDFTAANAKELTDKAKNGTILDLEARNVWPGQPPAEFAQLLPGGYSVCAVALPAEITMANAEATVSKVDVDSLAVFCQPVKVSPEPATQTAAVTVTVPPMPQ